MNLDMIVFFMEGKGYVYFVVINLWGYFIKGRISYRGLEVLVFFDGIELKRRGIFYLLFGVRKGDVEVVYVMVILVMWEGDVLMFRNYFLGYSEIVLKGVEFVKVSGGKIVDGSDGEVFRIVIEYFGEYFEVEFF